MKPTKNPPSRCLSWIWTLLMASPLVLLAQGQCPWTRDSIELHADCICDFNPSVLMGQTELQHPVNRMSVQCAPVNFERLMAALKQTASVELPAILLDQSGNNHILAGNSSSSAQASEELADAANQLASQTKLDLLHVSNSTIGQLKRNTFILDLATTGLAPANELLTKARHLVVAVQSLHLSRSQIELVEPGAFNGLEWSLNSLSLSDNLIQFVPTGAIQRLTNLRVLDLSNNRLATLRANDFLGLNKLQILRLDDNRLPKRMASSMGTTISTPVHNGEPAKGPTALSGIDPQAFAGLEASLSELNLKNMQLETFPIAVKHLTRLAFLNLAQNQIARLPGCSFSSLNSLTAISLERNRITHIDEDTFSGVEGSLLSLSLLGNLISSFPGKQIAKLVQIRRLDLGFNAIESIPLDAFRSNEELILVALDGNPLESIPEAAFKPLEGHLRGLSVGGRALNCDCHLSWMLRWQQEHGMQVSSRERHPQFCGQPTYLRSLTSFSALKPEHLVCESRAANSSTNSLRPTTQSDRIANSTARALTATEETSRPLEESLGSMGQDSSVGTNSIGMLPDDELFISDSPLRKLNRQGFLTNRLLRNSRPLNGSFASRIATRISSQAPEQTTTGAEKWPSRGTFGYRAQEGASGPASRWELRKVTWLAGNPSQKHDSPSSAGALSNVNPSSVMPIMATTPLTTYKPDSRLIKGARFVEDSQQQAEVYHRAAAGNDGQGIEIERTNQKLKRPNLATDPVASSSTELIAISRAPPSVIPEELATRQPSTTLASPVAQNNTRMSVLSMYRLGLATRVPTQGPTTMPTTPSVTTQSPRAATRSTAITLSATQATIADTTTRVAASVRFVESAASSTNPLAHPSKPPKSEPQTSPSSARASQPGLLTASSMVVPSIAQSHELPVASLPPTTASPARLSSSALPPIAATTRDQTKPISGLTPPIVVTSQPRQTGSRNAGEPPMRSPGPRVPLVGRLMVGWSDWFDQLAVILAGLLSLSMLTLAFGVICVCLPSLACCRVPTSDDGFRAVKQRNVASTTSPRILSSLSSDSDESFNNHHHDGSNPRVSIWRQLICCLSPGHDRGGRSYVTPIHSLVMQDDSSSRASSQGQKSSNCTLATGALLLGSSKSAVKQLTDNQKASKEDRPHRGFTEDAISSIGRQHLAQLTSSGHDPRAISGKEAAKMIVSKQSEHFKGRPRSWSLSRGFGRHLAGSPTSSCDSDKSCSPGANRNNRYNLGEAHRAYLATRSAHQQIQTSKFVTSCMDQAGASAEPNSIYQEQQSCSDKSTLGDSLLPLSLVFDRVASQQPLGGSLMSNELNSRSVYSNVGQLTKRQEVSMEPRASDFIGSELVSMSAESHWPEPYVDPEDPASMDRDEHRLVHYIGPDWNREPEREANSSRRDNLPIAFDQSQGQRRSIVTAHREPGRSVLPSGLKWSMGPGNQRSASQRVPAGSTCCEHPGRHLHQPDGSALAATIGAETSLLKYRSIPSLTSVPGTQGNRTTGAFRAADASHWLRWTPTQTVNEDGDSPMRQTLGGWNRENHIESFYAPPTLGQRQQ